MPQPKSFYITTTLPYVNSEPHIGHAMEIVRADAIARHKSALGYEVFFNTGTDEHGLKILEKASSLNELPQTFVDRLVKKYTGLKGLLGLSNDLHFVRTTDPEHISAAQEFWKRCDTRGCIYKKQYKAKYCPGCELEKTDSEIENGHCFLHPNIDLVIIEEENYFFRFSIFTKQLLDLYEKRPDFVLPRFRLNEIQAFVERGLEDFSISRLKSKMSWGIPVPGDPLHVMYVWFDALVSYISTLGWPDDAKSFEKFWQNGTPVQYCGKDNLRQQSAMWQAMLMAAGLPGTHQIIVNGFITGEGGLKMSKSLGNAVDPLDIVKEYGTDALRYYVIREASPFEDSPFSPEQFKEAYNAHLANGLGNLVSRIIKMSETNAVSFDQAVFDKVRQSEEIVGLEARQAAGFETYDLQKAANAVWDLIAATDGIVEERQPFKKIKTEKTAAENDIRELLARLRMIGLMLSAIMPETAATIIDLIEKNKMPASPLFARK
ncbi:MAG: methionyl-tRNA synthetase [Candidatus Parcubacteria bacterium]|nr:methionyl-tRNA synthetase [Candidatus Parcubacteria bacterium]